MPVYHGGRLTMKERVTPGQKVQEKSCTDAQLAGFRQLICTHYREHGRRLPWRETFDPYAILVSEIMLQQTQVDRVLPKYLEFLAEFPGFEELARAELSPVLSLWQGLGYNRRAVSLRLCAQAVMARFAGALPRQVHALETLPGIGPYTARAVAAFAFGEPTPFIETNIRSVFIHHFFADRETVHDREIMPLVLLTLDLQEPRDWYYALMDYGAMLKKAGRNPGRKSVHHTRQSPFRGSNREQRSRILRMVLASPGVSRLHIVATLAAEAGSVDRNLLQLEREGLLRQDDGRLWVS